MEQLRSGAAFSEADYTAALDRRRSSIAEYRRRHDGVEALLFPTVPVVAPGAGRGRGGRCAYALDRT